MKCPKCNNELTEELAGAVTPENDYTYVRVHCAECGYEK